MDAEWQKGQTVLVILHEVQNPAPNAVLCRPALCLLEADSCQRLASGFRLGLLKGRPQLVTEGREKRDGREDSAAASALPS